MRGRKWTVQGLDADQVNRESITNRATLLQRPEGREGAGRRRSERPGHDLGQCVSWCPGATAKQSVSLDRREQASKEEVCRGGKQIGSRTTRGQM